MAYLLVGISDSEPSQLSDHRLWDRIRLCRDHKRPSEPGRDKTETDESGELGSARLSSSPSSRLDPETRWEGR